MYSFFLVKTAYFSPGFPKIKHEFMHGKVYPETQSCKTLYKQAKRK